MAEGPTRDELIAQLSEIAGRLGLRSISKSKYSREGGASEWKVLKYFDSWNAFVSAAGLEPDESSRRLEDVELFVAMREAFEQAGGIVTRSRFRKFCRHSESVYVKRWGRWDNVLRQFGVWAEQHAPDFPYFGDLPSADQSARAVTATAAPAGSPAWTPTQTTQLGPFLNFRGLQHTPINEQGVVFLFGMVAVDLGYVVEGVGTGYPDCEAKRCVSPSGDKWERVRIEFEFRSRNFRDHGHDPAGCDLVVCWEHNWPECPVEVLELRSAVAELED